MLGQQFINNGYVFKREQIGIFGMTRMEEVMKCVLYYHPKNNITKLSHVIWDYNPGISVLA